MTAATAHSYSLHNDEATSGSNFRKGAAALQQWTLLYSLSLDMTLLLLPGGQALSLKNPLLSLLLLELLNKNCQVIPVCPSHDT